MERPTFDTFFPFSRPSITDVEIAEVIVCLKSGWITTGPRVVAFEHALKEYHNAPHVICVSSATIGLQIALLALGLKPGDEVITTPMTFIATINSILHAGGRPVFVDIDPHTMNLDITKVAQAITTRTKVILPVHFAGLPVDLDPLYHLARTTGLSVVEDAASASGAAYKGRPIGSFGDIQVFSFHPNKNMTTGEGGAIMTRDTKIARRIRHLSFHGLERKDGQNDQVICTGFKANMMDIQAALGLHQLKKLDSFVAQRTKLAQGYLEELEDVSCIKCPTIPPYAHTHGWHLFTIQILPEAPCKRDAFRHMMKTRHVGTGLHYQACHRFPFLAERLKIPYNGFPYATDVGERIVSLPLHPQMSHADVRLVSKIIKDILKKNDS